MGGVIHICLLLLWPTWPQTAPGARTRTHPEHPTGSPSAIGLAAEEATVAPTKGEDWGDCPQCHPVSLAWEEAHSPSVCTHANATHLAPFEPPK